MSTEVKTFLPVGFSANSFIAESDGDIALVDAGALNAELKEYLSKNGDRVKYILLTHDHFDHICAVPNALELCKNAKVAVHKADATGLCDSQYSLCDMAGVVQPSIVPDILLEDESHLPFGKGEIRVLHTPGHTDGSVCYIFGDVIFSGDTLFAGSVGRTDFISGSASALQSSLCRLALLGNDYTVYCGHGDATTLQKEIKTNPFFNI